MGDQPAFTDTRRFKVMKAVIGATNPLMVRMLGSRLGGPMSKALLLLRFTGRKSGKVYTTPVGYAREDDHVVIVTSPTTYRQWRNVRDGATVEVRLDGAWRRGEARVLSPSDPTFDAAVALHVRQRGPGLLRGFGVPVDDSGAVPGPARAGMDTKALIVLVQLEPSSDARIAA